MVHQQADARNERRWIAAACVLLAAIVFAVFGRTLTQEFVDFDDNAYVYDNPVVQRGLTQSGVVWAFSGAHAHNWHPLTWLSHELDCQIYGLHPWGHHLSNVLLHSATVVALFLVLRSLTGALWRSAFVAAVFAIHPLRVESVAWVAERKDVLSGLFFVLTIGAYARYARGPHSAARYGLVLLLFALGLMSKPMLVTLPVVLLILDYWPLQRPEPFKKLVLEKLPLFALSAASCAATILAQRAAIQSTGSFPLPMRFANAVVSCAVYLRQTIWPSSLAVFYPYPHHGLPLWQVTLAAVVLAGISAVAIQQWRKRPWLLAGWLWYLVTLLPVMGIVQMGNAAHADRYTYLPQIGVCIAVTWLAAQWPLSRRVFAGLMAGVVAVLAICAWNQTQYWQNSETLWARALAVTSDSDMAHFGMGNVFLKKKVFDKAISEFQSALQIKPYYPEAHNNIGNALLEEGRAQEALPHFQIALQMQPDYADARFGLGNVFLQEGKPNDAIACYQKTIQDESNNATMQGNFGIALFQIGKTNEAFAHLQTALQLKPDDADAQFNFGNALFLMGKADDALPYVQRALQLRPDFAQAHFCLGLIFLKQGKTAEAIAQDQAALQLEPSNALIQNGLAWLLATCPETTLRDGNKAVQLARQANDLTGEKNPYFLRTLAAAYAETGRFDDARQSLQTAIAIARAAGREDVAKMLDNDLKRYEAGHSWSKNQNQK